MCADQPAGGAVRKPHPLDNCAVRHGGSRELRTHAVPDYRWFRGGGIEAVYDDCSSCKLEKKNINIAIIGVSSKVNYWGY